MKIPVKKRKLSEYLLYLGVIAAGIGIDVLTKALADKLRGGPSVPILRGVLQLTYSTNTGAAWGMLSEEGQRWIFLVTSTVMILGLAAYLFLGFAENRLYGIACALVVSGGIGNMIERVGKGYVVDFIDFCLINFPIFNGADSFVCVGAGLMIFALIRDIIREEKEKKSK